MHAITIAVVTTILLFSAATNSVHAANVEKTRWYCDRQPVIDFWEQDITGEAMSGSANLCTLRNEVWGDMNVQGLLPGGSYTVWWVYIDNPAACANFPLTTDTADIPFNEPVGYADGCGLADFFTPDDSGDFLNPLAVFGRMDGVVAGTGNRNRFVGQLRTFTPTPGSQMWLFAFGHGPADQTDNRQLARQLLTPEDPLSGVPHVGIEGRRNGYPAGVAVFRF